MSTYTPNLVGDKIELKDDLTIKNLRYMTPSWVFLQILRIWQPTLPV